jgi:DNA-binding MarR family transcriptional regulator
MVKRLDHESVSGSSPGLDHIGWQLWKANRLWLSEFVGAMQRAGHAWFGPAEANLLGHLDGAGTSQALLTERLGVTKQAVQQALDQLEAAGIVRRDPNPADKRGRIVRYTKRGQAAMSDADRIKLELEGEFAARIGAERLATLHRLLAQLTDGAS